MLNQKEGPSTLEELVQSVHIDISGSSEYKRFQRTYSRDRIAFVYDVMPEAAKSLAFYQEEMLGEFDNGVTRLAVRGPHGLGKTFVAAILVHHGILTAEEDAKVPTTASAWRQLEKYLWPEIRKLERYIAWHVVGRPAYNRVTEFFQLSIKLIDRGVEAFALASDDHTTLEGAHAKRILFVFDEAKTIPAPTWDALEGAFSSEGLDEEYEALAFAISTPGDPAGRFYDIHSGAPGYDDWTTKHVTVDDAIKAGRISGYWVEQRRKQWGEESAVFQNRVLGEFSDNSDEGMIPLSWIRKAIERWKNTENVLGQTGTSYAGVDVARMGQDVTVLALRTAFTLKTIYEFRKSRTTETAGRITTLCKDHIVNIEMDGLGAAVYDMLRENGFPNVRPVHPNGKTWMRDRSGELEFLNVRAAMWWYMRELLDPDNGYDMRLPPHALMMSDLSAPVWEQTSTGKIKLESKLDLRKRIGRSTDVGDAVCLSFWQTSRGGGIVI